MKMVPKNAKVITYYDFLTKHKNIKLISSLADILIVFAYFQKKLQSDSITILDISKQTLFHQFPTFQNIPIFSFNTNKFVSAKPFKQCSEILKQTRFVSVI